MTSPVPSTPLALTTAANFKRQFPALVSENVDPITIDQLLVNATSYIEVLCSRRLAPFTNTICEDELIGLSPDEYGDTDSGMPLPFAGSLGVSFANALGANDLVRHFSLDEYAPVYPELWTYSITSMNLILTYGNTQPIDVPGGGVINIDKTSGDVWLRLGTFAPEGSRINVVYSGGYTVAIPPTLIQACLFVAQKFLILQNEPGGRAGTSFDVLDSQIASLIGPWVRG